MALGRAGLGILASICFAFAAVLVAWGIGFMIATMGEYGESEGYGEIAGQALPFTLVSVGLGVIFVVAGIRLLRRRR